MSRFYTPQEGAWMGREEDDPARTALEQEEEGSLRAECARLSARAAAAEESAARAWERVNEMRAASRQKRFGAAAWGVLAAAVIAGMVWRLK